jgi:general secretion pathway protein D
MSDTISKVPVLGDLPLLGGMFQYRTRSRTKTNLLVFLRPTVLRDGRQVDALTSERYDYIRGEQDRARAQGAATAVLPNVGGPSLPDRSPAAEAAPAQPK